MGLWEASLALQMAGFQMFQSKGYMGEYLPLMALKMPRHCRRHLVRELTFLPSSLLIFLPFSLCVCAHGSSLHISDPWFSCLVTD